MRQQTPHAHQDKTPLSYDGELNTVRWNSHGFSEPKPLQHYKLFGQAIQGSSNRSENT